MKKNLSAVQLDLGTAPLIEMSGNRRVNVEGSTGILLYETSNIKVSTNRMVLSFEGRGLSVRCISGSCVEIEGFITKIEFIS
ncbi:MULTISPECIES: YabP/YqfC family sporulation protein [Ruminococcus]|jgi:sporulation protein YqfC|uniref:YabP/YqfC family sporulation protein n=1 Tax=Ruminococcus difficilis TaxID=2763069 RepID=A0A934WRZ6_9FIRM|nr:YabP/YqfC family sporulation protein [Ruminococcus difficilis]MBQ1354488.1 YabP/YqfC family sporulation protein [Ruminococcus sp.]MDO4893054.1 YabP/YqfC family sporulation protein [Eubacteriales bacterium]MBK6088842.1 YabP/YqfC family sporulation protein [Ruminococcus difficilis]MBQ1830647.1 YabP/YqfC family sporulation protein [Ruminococcus sp.]MBQ1921462.1 YabP/YqfC family sporulation protein [Ruminococcus sp.]